MTTTIRSESSLRHLRARVLRERRRRVVENVVLTLVMVGVIGLNLVAAAASAGFGALDVLNIGGAAFAASLQWRTLLRSRELHRRDRELLDAIDGALAFHRAVP